MRFLSQLFRRGAAAAAEPAIPISDAGQLARFAQFAGVLEGVHPLSFAAEPGTGRGTRLNVLVPWLSPRGMSGGPNTLLNLAYRIASRGVPVRFVSTDLPKEDDEGLWRHLAALTGIGERLPNVELACGYDRSKPLPAGGGDVFFASAWWNAQMIKRAGESLGRRPFLYLIQDFEPGLYPWSTQYALALETYGLDFHGIFCSGLLAEYFVLNRVGRFADPAFAARCVSFEPAVDRSRFFPSPSPHAGPRRLLFYARPTAARRNLFELGLYALREAVAAGHFDGWEMHFIGENLPEVDLGRGVSIRPRGWMDYDEYASFVRGSDVMLALMLSPHTSYPPLEMAGSGGVAVTTCLANKDRERLRAISPGILGVAPTVEGVVAGLAEASARIAAGQRGAEMHGVPGSWDEAFAPVLDRIEAMVAQCAAGGAA